MVALDLYGRAICGHHHFVLFMIYIIDMPLQNSLFARRCEDRWATVRATTKHGRGLYRLGVRRDKATLNTRVRSHRANQAL